MSQEPQSTTTAPETKTDAAQFVVKIFEQWKTIIMHPKQFFENMPLEGGLVAPLMFVVFMGVFASIGILLANVFHPIVGIDGAIKTVLGAVIGSFIGAAITWILCKLFGGTGNYEQTYRACAFASAPHAFGIIPIPIIGILATLYAFYLLFLGVKRAHQLTTPKAAIVVGIEVGAAVILVAIIVILMVVAIAAHHH